MKLDKNDIDKLTMLSDDHLWKIICALGTSSGIDLSGVKVGSREMENVRKALSQVTDDDIGRATEIIANCKKGEGNGRNR
ncbi:MAG: hypothetical protein IJ499_06280 [Clostridia bacterium]|nr:hypothetical protein [Clostridia bacterium]